MKPEKNEFRKKMKMDFIGFTYSVKNSSSDMTATQTQAQTQAQCVRI